MNRRDFNSLALTGLGLPFVGENKEEELLIYHSVFQQSIMFGKWLKTFYNFDYNDGKKLHKAQVGIAHIDAPYVTTSVSYPNLRWAYRGEIVAIRYYYPQWSTLVCKGLNCPCKQLPLSICVEVLGTTDKTIVLKDKTDIDTAAFAFHSAPDKPCTKCGKTNYKLHYFGHIGSESGILGAHCHECYMKGALALKK